MAERDNQLPKVVLCLLPDPCTHTHTRSHTTGKILKRKSHYSPFIHQPYRSCTPRDHRQLRTNHTQPEKSTSLAHSQSPIGHMQSRTLISEFLFQVLCVRGVSFCGVKETKFLCCDGPDRHLCLTRTYRDTKGHGCSHSGDEHKPTTR